MGTINVFIKKENKEKIEKMKVKYQLSLTTIIDILVFETLTIFKNELDQFKADYIHTKGNKTSIKEPKIFKMVKLTQNEKMKLCTNVLNLFINHEFKNYIKDQTTLNKFYSKCDRKMQDTFEENWNFNSFIRMQRRMLRQNKEYFRKALEQC